MTFYLNIQLVLISSSSSYQSHTCRLLEYYFPITHHCSVCKPLRSQMGGPVGNCVLNGSLCGAGKVGIGWAGLTLGCNIILQALFHRKYSKIIFKKNPDNPLSTVSINSFEISPFSKVWLAANQARQLILGVKLICELHL